MRWRWNGSPPPGPRLAAGSGHRVRSGVLRDRFDGTLVTAHSDKQGAAPTYKRGFGHHPLLAFLDATVALADGETGHHAEAAVVGDSLAALETG